MDNSHLTIRQMIRILANDGKEHFGIICKVEKVLKERRAVNCQPIDGSAPILAANLQANQGSDFGVIVWPREGSYVIVGVMTRGDSFYVAKTDDIESIEIVISKDSTSIVVDDNGVEVKVGDKVSMTLDGESIKAKNGDNISFEMTDSVIKFNGGEKYGVPLSKLLVGQINDIKNDINNLKDIFLDKWVPPIGTPDSGAALKTAAEDWAGKNLNTIDVTDIENTQIVQ